MLASTVADGDRVTAADRPPTDLRLVSQFLVGGVTATIGAVLLGDVGVDREHLVDVLVSLFEAIRAASSGSAQLDRRELQLPLPPFPIARRWAADLR